MGKIYYKTQEEIALIEESAQLVSKTLGILAAEIKEGITPLQLDSIAEVFIRDHNAKPGFLGLYDFPNTLCTSVNECIAHGIPDKRPLQNGDIISIDCGAIKNGFYGDHAYTFQVGEVKEEIKKLCEITKDSLYRGISQLKVGNRMGDVGFAIASLAKKNKLGIVRELIGHGLGHAMHEGPDVPNYGSVGKGLKIYDGLVLAIEPMFNLGSRYIRKPSSGWNIITADKKPSAHFEHNVAVVGGKPKLLSTFSFIEEALAGKVA